MNGQYGRYARLSAIQIWTVRICALVIGFCVCLAYKNYQVGHMRLFVIDLVIIAVNAANIGLTIYMRRKFNATIRSRYSA
jgi:hypothetical protein